ncbi:MAG: pyridoxal phosphate-dependent aminotransferase [Prevotellaceae bacterium]|jgi:aspartate/methionine/tyrosine aminotransferase|nr:pyridoxal phosphate-dependent aminotransferase [Prevotellaceae bacterium]
MSNPFAAYRAQIQAAIDQYNLPDFGRATIREIVGIANKIEQLTGERYIRMEIGVPGLPPSRIGVEAEIAALNAGVAAKYPALEGMPELKQEASRFIKAFINADVKPEGCVPVVGSMQGTFAAFVTASQCDAKKDTVLFIDPGFPVQKLQLTVLGVKYESFDAYEYRGKKLGEKIAEYLEKGNIAAIIYSNPNNPAWICLTEDELRMIGELATQHDAIVIEDLAYFAMDSRKDLSRPFQAPFQPTVARYTDNYILLISGSKAFSYAGQRIGIAGISDKLFSRQYENLKARYGVGGFGNVLVNRVLYSVSAGTAHSAQYALCAMFRAANNGEFNFLAEVSEYGKRAKKMKEIFLQNGFELVYDKDLGEPLGDGFYFTVRYPTMTGSELMKELMFYGISAISLVTTGSKQEGLRVCSSFVQSEQFDDLEIRLRAFAEEHK